MLNDVTEIQVDGKEIFLIGTAHVSRESVDLVRTTIEEVKPDVVAVELCEQRHHAIVNQKRWDETGINKVIQGGRTYLFLMQLLLTNFQRKIGDELGVKPGSEMIQALDMAKERDIPVALVDRDIQITLKRAFNRMSLREKLKILYGLISGVFEGEEINEDLIEELKEKDVLTELMEELGREVPSIKEVLVDERNHYIADKIIGLKEKKVVGVVGAGHVEGIKNLLESRSEVNVDEELMSLEKVPEKRSKLKFGYLIPLAFLLIVGYGFLKDPSGLAVEMLWKWFLINGSLSALGVILAFGHPLSVVSAFLAAPFTSLNPAIAAGWVAGIVEAYVRKPKVKDFEGLLKLNGLRDYWGNGVTRIFLVIAFANLGSSIGTFIALPYLASLL
ncbi:MAG: TraB/GumN family protein [Candidatus Altiarchaeota archaeon]|nr:TraB/GumN family protein [Candidatus Altiarchaeota archaeon]